MKRNTKWKIFRSNLIVIILLITLVTMIFNLAVHFYIKSDILTQLNKIASHTEDTALQQGPDFFPDKDLSMPSPNVDNDIFRFYFMLDQSLREPLSMINASYILFDKDKNIITPSPDTYSNTSPNLLTKIQSELLNLKDINNQTNLNFTISGIDYTAIIKPVVLKNSFGLGYIIVFSNLQKINEFKIEINLILLAILFLSALITVIFSSITAKKISSPFSSLSQHIKSIAERNFDTKIYLQVDDELQDFVNNINTMSENLETYYKAQKTFLENISHEFRTPLMSIQSYAEGIIYKVVEPNQAAQIIIDESKRMTILVEDLLYLSRL
ncbi:MAG TPA: HAMP domain-containing sensor histidine kinase, partial [Clostridiaceae bacterium]